MQMRSKMFEIRKYLKHLNSATIFIFSCLTTESFLLVFLLLIFFQNKVFNCLNVIESTCLTISICISTGSLLQYVPSRQALNSSSLCSSDRVSLISAKSPVWKKRIKRFYFNSKVMNSIYLTCNSPFRRIIHFWSNESLKWSFFSIGRRMKSMKQEKEKKYYKKSGKMQREWIVSLGGTGGKKEIVGGRVRDYRRRVN